MKSLFVKLFVVCFLVASCKGGGGSQQVAASEPEAAGEALFGSQQPGQPGRGGRNMGTAEERAKAQVERLSESVTLTAAQKTSIEAIELEIQKQVDDRRQNAQGDAEAMRAAMREIETIRVEKYGTVLTAEQLRTYTEAREQRRRERGQGCDGQGRGQGGGGQGGQRRQQ